MKCKITFSLLIFTSLLLASCGSFLVDSTTPTSFEIPASPISPMPKGTTTPAPSVTPSSTYSLTEVVAAATRTAYATELAYRFTSIPATIEARNAKCKEGFELEQALYVLDYSTDEWTLFTCSPLLPNGHNGQTPGTVDYGKRYTVLVKTDLSKAWTIQHNTFDYSIIDRPDALMVPLRWTGDGKYLYLYPAYYPGGSGFSRSYFLYSYINDLYRINLETGEFKLFLKTDQFSDLAFSPNDQFLAYSELDRPDIIHIRNMESENDQQVKLYENVIVAGAFIWNSESTKVVFFVGYSKQGGDWQDDLSGTSIFSLTPQNMHLQKVFAKDTRTFGPYKCSDNTYWVDNDTICLDSYNQELDSWNKIFTFNIKTGVVKFLRHFP